MRSAGRALTSALLALVLVACGGSSPPPATSARPPLPALPLLLPEGADLVVVVHPRDVLASSALRALLDAALSSEQRQRLATIYGVDLERASEAVIGTYPNGWLAIVRGSLDARTVVRISELEMDSVDRRASEPFARVEGYFGTDAMHVAALDRDVVAAGTAMPDVVAGLLERAVGRGQPALEGESAELVDARARAPIVIVGPQPVDVPPDLCGGCDAAALFAGERALAASIAGQGNALDIDLELRGAFPDTAEQNFTALVRSIGESSLGAAFGMNAAAQSLVVHTDERGVRLSLELDSAVVARGVRDLFSTEVHDIAGDQPRPGGAPSGG